MSLGCRSPQAPRLVSGRSGAASRPGGCEPRRLCWVGVARQAQDRASTRSNAAGWGGRWGWPGGPADSRWTGAGRHALWGVLSAMWPPQCSQTRPLQCPQSSCRGRGQRLPLARTGRSPTCTGRPGPQAGGGRVFQAPWGSRGGQAECHALWLLSWCTAGGRGWGRPGRAWCMLSAWGAPPHSPLWGLAPPHPPAGRCQHWADAGKVGVPWSTAASAGLWGSVPCPCEHRPAQGPLLRPARVGVCLSWPTSLA